MNHELVVLSGLPRSGSTVLCSLLNQHPKLYATTTSPVLGMVLNFRNNWDGQTIAQVDDRNEKQRDDMVSSLIQSAHAYIDKPVVIDKNRGWPKHYKLLRTALGKKPKMICTVRDIPSILASFVTLANKNPNDNFIDNTLKREGFVVNNTNRCRVLWNTGTVGEAWQCFKSGFQNKDADMIVIEYDDIVSDPLNVMRRVEEYLEIEPFAYDINNLRPMKEKDEFHGLKGLHDIRSNVSKKSLPREQIIGKELTDYYNNMKLDFWH